MARNCASPGVVCHSPSKETWLTTADGSDRAIVAVCSTASTLTLCMLVSFALERSRAAGWAGEEGGRDEQVAGDQDEEQCEPLAELSLREAACDADADERAGDAGRGHRQCHRDVEPTARDEV